MSRLQKPTLIWLVCLAAVSGTWIQPRTRRAAGHPGWMKQRRGTWIGGCARPYLPPPFRCHRRGTPCVVDLTCASNVCADHRCVDCTEDFHCEGDLFCSAPVRRCVPLVSLGGACHRDGMCATGLCRSAVCVQCEADYNCWPNACSSHGLCADYYGYENGGY